MKQTLKALADNQPQVSRSPSNHSARALDDHLLSTQSDDDFDTSKITTEEVPIRLSTSANGHLRDNSSSSTAVTVTSHMQGAGDNIITHDIAAPVTAHPNGEQLRSTAEAATELAEAMDFDWGPPTPTDDTPYLRFALDQLTIDRDVRALQRPGSVLSDDSYSVDRIVPDQGLGYLPLTKNISGPSLVNVPPLMPCMSIQYPHCR